MLTEVIDPKEEDNEEEVLKEKDAISKDFANLLDEILEEKNKDVTKSLDNFKEELFKFASSFFVGDLFGRFPELKEENKESLDKLLWTSEINIENKKEDLIGIVLSKKEDLEKNNGKVSEDINGQNEKMLENILAEYKQYITEYKKAFEEETKEQFKKLKEVIQKDLKITEEK
ncbi:hypothetical protein [Mycoplasma capricolum]|nr:hypothetical protein [Mycoplasma capricolum]